MAIRVQYIETFYRLVYYSFFYNVFSVMFKQSKGGLQVLSTEKNDGKATGWSIM